MIVDTLQTWKKELPGADRYTACLPSGASVNLLDVLLFGLHGSTVAQLDADARHELRHHPPEAPVLVGPARVAVLHVRDVDAHEERPDGVQAEPRVAETHDRPGGGGTDHHARAAHERHQLLVDVRG